jgi:RNA polymerase sigma-70 factor (ECF subfamily)
VRRLGIPAGSVEDAVQEVFVVVHRKLGEFEGRSSLKTWLFGIVLRVVRDQRRAMRRKGMPLGQEDPETVGDEAGGGPDERAAKAEAVRTLHALLDELDDEKREIFVLAELEQMSVPEIADALGVNLNTVYSRLRAARQQFEEAVTRHRARDRWRLG